MLENYNNINFNLNKFLSDVRTKKQYVKQLQNKVILLTNIKKKNYKASNYTEFLNKKQAIKKNLLLVTHILGIYFSRTNTLFHVMDCSGNIKFFYSAGSFNIIGKEKIARALVFRKFYRILTSQLKFLKKKPIAVHFKNVGFNMFWLLKKLKKKFYIVSVKNFSLSSYNGCRRRKVRRKKIKRI